MKTIITGMGCVCALGAELTEIKRRLYANALPPVGAQHRVQSVYAQQYPVFPAPQEVLAQKREDESYGFLFLRHAADEALARAGLSVEVLRQLRVGVVAGTSVDASFNCFDFYKEWRAGTVVSCAPLLHYLRTPLSGALQAYYGVSGPQITLTTACASGTDAVGLAAQWIEQGLCDVVIACATDELNLIPYLGFIRLMIASQQHCTPFSKGRLGLNLGEGAGVFILESAALAATRNQHPLGYVLGYGSCADAYHATAPDPQGRGLKQALCTVLANPALSLEKLAFINAHGTGTPDNDAVEAKVFNELLPGLPVMASKSMTGHTLGAAGAVEAILSLLCLNEGMIPKTANFTERDERLGLTPVTRNTPIAHGKETALSDSLAFGGCNSVIALGSQRYKDEG